ncbi:MAG: TldD/PmbA family protein [Candidatus Zixiibacteriota bacterium]
MNIDETLELAKWTIKIAKNYGADEAAVDIINLRSVDIEHRDGKLDKLEESIQNSLNINIYAKNRYSSHSTNDLKKENLEKFISEAVSLTKYLGEDPFRKLPDPKYYIYQRIDLDLYDPEYHNVTSEQRVKVAKKLQEYTSSLNEKVVSCTSYVSDTLANSVKVRSNGFEGSLQTTTFSTQVAASINDGKGNIPNDYGSRTSRHYNEMPDLEEMGKEVIERAIRKLGQSKIATGVYDMIVENRVATGLLGRLIQPMDGRLIQQNQSCFAKKIGEQIASEKLTIKDNPFIMGGLGSRLFDGEGMATRERVFFDKGVLKSFLIDNYYANKLGVEPTSSGRTNTIIEPGTKSLDELIAGTQKGILVTSFIGGNSNSTTGDFSTGISGMMIENGQIVKPINEMNITGNLLEFWHHLAEVGNDVYKYSTWLRPSLYFKDIEISGA